MNTPLCECGCGLAVRIAPQSHKEKGWIKGQPLRFRRGHAAKTRRRKPFGILYAIDSATGCWNWTGIIGTGGYPYYYNPDTRKQERAHRRSYIDTYGEIAVGLQIDHLCRNRACVNPEHLEAVTAAENNRRSNSVSSINARKTHCIWGHELTPDNVRVYAGSRHCLRCRERRSHARRKSLI